MISRFTNVWDAIEDTPALAENMKLRSSLMLALKDHIARKGLTQSQAAKIFGVSPASFETSLKTIGPSLTNPPAVIGRFSESRTGAKSPKVAEPPCCCELEMPPSGRV